MAKLLFGIFTSVMLLCIIPALWMLYSTISFRNKAVKTEGKVIKMKSSRGTKGSRTYAPVVIFTANNGKEYTCHSDIYSNPPSYSVGDNAEVYYNPADPADVQIGGAGAFLGTYILGGIGLIFSLPVLLIYFKKIKKKPGSETDSNFYQALK